MPFIEKLFWTLSAVLLVCAYAGGASDYIEFIVIPLIWLSMFFCWMVIRIKSGIGALLIPGVSIENILNEIYAGRLSVQDKELKYIESARRVVNYGFIPFVIMVIIEWCN